MCAGHGVGDGWPSPPDAHRPLEPVDRPGRTLATEESTMRTVVLHAALHDDEWNKHVRDESPMQRLDRNWSDLVQEMRVLQTGVSC